MLYHSYKSYKIIKQQHIDQTNSDPHLKWKLLFTLKSPQSKKELSWLWKCEKL